MGEPSASIVVEEAENEVMGDHIADMSHHDAQDAEMEWTAGPQREMELLKVCDRVSKCIKDAEIRMVAEIAKHWRTSDPKRVCFEEVAAKVTQDALDMVKEMKERCVSVQKERENYEEAATSLGCTNYESFVGKLEELVECSLMVGEIKEGTNWQHNDIVKNCCVLHESVVKKKQRIAQLQAQLEAKQREIDELRRRAELMNAGHGHEMMDEVEVPGKDKLQQHRTSLKALREIRKNLTHSNEQLQSGQENPRSSRGWTTDAFERFSRRRTPSRQERKVRVQLHQERGETSVSGSEGPKMDKPKAREDKVVVSKRSYVAPGECKWVEIRGGGEPGEKILESTSDWIHSGLCAVDDSGATTVPVWNVAAEPLVLKVGQEVGTWEHDDAQFAKVTAKQIPTDMLVFGEKGLDPNERRKMLD
ncbi:unnamed protein product, partial [Nippostrongylus brasiliensis]|uniref:XH domain-containing protein n=1 Tax=Nippostrongylus brasiliensis TaxID=27835 RepID=A0A0N4YYJ2_NIPBR